MGGIVVGKLKLVAVPIDDEETAFRYTKPRLPRWWKSSMGRSHDGSVQPFVPGSIKTAAPSGSAHGERRQAAGPAAAALRLSQIE